jgi:hypothetical protein
MNRKHKFFLPAMAFVVLLGLQLSAGNAFAQGPGPGGPGAGGPGGPGEVVRAALVAGAAGFLLSLWRKIPPTV